MNGNERVGEEKVATNGMRMKIVKYHTSSNIDIMFEDGAMVFHKNYVDFKRGKIGYPVKSKVGETSIAKNGMSMKVVAYRKYKDIDVEFEDGKTVYNKSYDCFLKGEIAYPQGERIGEKITARNGMTMKIVAYRSSKDIDVEFEDGATVYGRTYVDFKHRKIGYPTKNRVGECIISKKGIPMKIVAYRNSQDVDIEFEDGTIAKSKDYRSFKKGSVENPSRYEKYIGEENVARNGMKMKIVKFRNSKDIDIEFEDGQVVQNRDYYSFCVGNIGCPRQNRIGEENVARNGMKMKIIQYQDSSDIDIQFEDGAIVKHKTYLNFRQGLIGYPRPDHIGEENIANNGLKMKIIAYRNSSDINIEFEDGVRVEHRGYQNFKEGAIKYPEFRIGEERIANNGLKMKIIAYRSATDIDVEFEDGTIVKSKGYKEFKRGQIGHPYISVKRSLPEKIICYYIGKREKYVPSYKPNWLLNNGKIIGNRKNELDIYIPNKKMAIEYDGVRFHQDVDKDNKKSKSVFEHKEDIEIFVRIREEGCPCVEDFDNQQCLEITPFSEHDKRSLADLEKVIFSVMSMLGYPNEMISISSKVIDYCKSEMFYNLELQMCKNEERLEGKDNG